VIIFKDVAPALRVQKAAAAVGFVPIALLKVEAIKNLRSILPKLRKGRASL